MQIDDVMALVDEYVSASIEDHGYRSGAASAEYLEDTKRKLLAAIAALIAAPAAPQQAEPVLNERVGLAYKNGYEEALNDCIRNGGEAWARSMFANGGEHIKPQQAEPVAWVEVLDRDEGPYEFHGQKLLPRGKHSLYLHPPADEVRRLRDALDEIESETQDVSIQQIARKALEGK